MQQTIIKEYKEYKEYKDMTIDELIKLLESLKVSKSRINKIDVLRRDIYIGEHIAAVEHLFSVQTEDIFYGENQ